MTHETHTDGQAQSIAPHVVKEELLGLILSDAKFMNEREDIAAYIHTLKAKAAHNAFLVELGLKPLP